MKVLILKSLKYIAFSPLVWLLVITLFFIPKLRQFSNRVANVFAAGVIVCLLSAIANVMISTNFGQLAAEYEWDNEVYIRNFTVVTSVISFIYTIGLGLIIVAVFMERKTLTDK